MLGFGGIGALARGAAFLTGQGLKSVATGKSGATAAGAFYGALAGGVWGGVSDDTSVIGGAIMGAGLGAAGGRYGGAQLMGIGAFGQARRDYRALKGYLGGLGGKKEHVKAQAQAAKSSETIGNTNIASNTAVNKINGLKGGKRVPPGIQKIRREQALEDALTGRTNRGWFSSMPAEVYTPPAPAYAGRKAGQAAWTPRTPRGEDQTLRNANKMWSQTKPTPQLSTLELARLSRLGY